jgi:hypothetical protein
MQRYGQFASFGTHKRYRDGVMSTLEFSAYADAQFAWRYSNLTDHTDYLAALIDRTIRSEMRREAKLMRDGDNARTAVKDILDGRNSDIDRIIRAVRDNQWPLSNKLRKAFPIIESADLGDALVTAIRLAFDDAA